MYKLAALYIINIKIRLTINNNKKQTNKKEKSTSTINAYINIKTFPVHLTSFPQPSNINATRVMNSESDSDSCFDQLCLTLM